MHAFDLSDRNEPVVVLTAKARMPAKPNASSDLQYVITLVARDDMYGDLHKVFASVTDSQHFDVLTRLELIDAVDADGRRAGRVALPPGFRRGQRVCSVSRHCRRTGCGPYSRARPGSDANDTSATTLSHDAVGEKLSLHIQSSG